ncbi:MBL fold metallo-hydrolase [Plebeiibacterium marinum]|uniref:MBL fold metallo-hydrolase n=1 Tax=Plebeiibacterium marinum TaxID=2992111 RepID=A0AAE3SJT8_9BACT|nr:MBL fold metallo-hydrolase [Plebeiobacterium marinum]MCW3805778.1 MBL fold metallo-hydrolase [Plebeiobacterium marinum]
MKVTFLGTGTSQGVPVIACDCKVCKSNDLRDVRLRSSVLIETDDVTLVIDSGPDFRQQMLRADVKTLDGILFTHEHKDHIAGLDDVRAFNWITRRHADVFAEQRVVDALRVEFSYAFDKNPYPGVPKIELNTITEAPFTIKGLKVVPIRGKHLNLPVLGYRINDFTYLTDFNFISDTELEKVKGSRVLVVNAVRKEPHISHYCLNEAVAVIQKAVPAQGYITHISHQLGLYNEENPLLPANINLAYDELVLDI